jgi:signal transduction histidine kinase/CheY-like chemotaxis protein
MMSLDQNDLEIKRLRRELRILQNRFEHITQQFRSKELHEQAQAAFVARQEEYNKVLLESSPALIVLLDKEGRFKLCTRSFLEVVNAPNYDYVYGRHYKELIKDVLEEEDVRILEENFENVMHNKKETRFSRFFDFSGKGNPRYYTEESRRTEDTQYSEASFLTVFVDSTDLEEEKQRAEEASRAKSDFLAAMSHEIRTPMNAIVGLSDLAVRRPLDDTLAKYMREIKSSVGSLQTIIDDILDFSKIEAGKMEVVNVPYDLHALLEHLYSMFVAIFAEKDLYLRINLSPDLPRWTNGDEVRVRQSLTNLLSNAAKYTREGGAILDASLDTQTGELVFAIRDTGIGIKTEDFDKLFKSFERLDIMKNRAIQGTGLGLPISSNFCRLMGGSLSVESVYGEGSCFTVRLPYVSAEGQDVPIHESADVFSAPNLKVLVVDDIEINLQVAEAMLQLFDMSPDLAGSGPEAIEKVTECDYDLVFMDHMMPGMDGVEATEKIRAMGGRFAELPIIALTANVANNAERQFLSHGFTGFLAKPLEIATLSRCLRQFLTAHST